tara:strand:+ start:2120 stop:2452 length:333 start_codon:yes stop_codon:yes gene_type:complete
MSVRKTSLDAYNELQVNGKANTQRGKILSFLLAHSNYVDEPFSRLELSDILEIPINAISGRVRELLDDNLVQEVPYKCSISKNNVNGIKPILSVQEDFFQPDTLMHQHHF